MTLNEFNAQELRWLLVFKCLRYYMGRIDKCPIIPEPEPMHWHEDISPERTVELAVFGVVGDSAKTAISMQVRQTLRLLKQGVLNGADTLEILTLNFGKPQNGTPQDWAEFTDGPEYAAYLTM